MNFKAAWGPQLSALAITHRLPSVHFYRESAMAGGLLSYAPSLTHIADRGAAYVDRILRGAKPADLPVEQPAKFELIVNLQTAKARLEMLTKPVCELCPVDLASGQGSSMRRSCSSTSASISFPLSMRKGSMAAWATLVAIDERMVLNEREAQGSRLAGAIASGQFTFRMQPTAAHCARGGE